MRNGKTAFLQKIIGQPVSPLGRALDLLCIPIADVVGTGYKGAELCRYEIHCQCAWRLTDPVGRIITASFDMFLPPETAGQTGDFSEDFSWNGEAGNLFDERIEAFDRRYGKQHIIAAEINGPDLTLEFDSGVRFDAFAVFSAGENWRLFQRSPSNIHLVCYGDRLTLHEECGGAQELWSEAPSGAPARAPGNGGARRLDELTGQPVAPLERERDMMCLQAGEFRICCRGVWRLLSPEGAILVASEEIYEPPDGLDFSEDFRWDGEAGNLFDVKIAALNRRLGGTHIAEAELNGHDLLLAFGNGMICQAFADSSRDESWHIERSEPA